MNAVLSVGVAILLTIPGLPVIRGISVVWPLGLALVLLYLSIIANLARLE